MTRWLIRHPNKTFATRLIKRVVLLALMSIAHEAIAQETRRVRFAVTNPPHFLPIWLAKDTGIFSKHGLDVEVIFMRGGALITMGILSGELQLSGVGAGREKKSPAAHGRSVYIGGY
jgi:ABC-type nitrate/sulfonate/bicarbonate transport system substrate-binding protein